MTPRPYQSRCNEAIASGFEEHDRQILVLPTGGGKTVIFAFEALRRHQSGARCLILAHREELIEQAAAKLRAATGIEASIEKAERRASLDAPVVIASVQSMHANRIGRWPQDHFELIICDEAHHAISDSWRGVLSRFDGFAQVLGVTATPDRGDKRNLGEYFQNIAAEVGLIELINEGFLSRIGVRTIPLQIDLSNVHSTGGDLNDAELAHAIEPYLRQIALSIKQHATFRRTLTFLPLVATSQKFVSICREVGIDAEHIDGESPDRADILARFAAGQFDLLSNAQLLTEGYDDPGIDCVCVLRPTRSRNAYAQMIGRGTRVAPSKQNLLLLDFLWHHERHSLIRPAHLVASDEVEADSITDITKARQQELDLQGIVSEAQAQREATLRKKLEEHKGRKGEFLDAADWCLLHKHSDLARYEATMKWESLPATAGQLKELQRLKINPGSIQGRGHAHQIITAALREASLKLASPGQRARMSQAGHPNADNATVPEARAFFAALRNRNRKPVPA